MAEQTIFWSFGKSGPAEGFLVVVIIVALIAQRNRRVWRSVTAISGSGT